MTNLSKAFKQANSEILKGGKPLFDKIELCHLMTLIEINEREKWYYGNQTQYWKRSERIKNKLKSML